jgi:feruloyl-CoA synthase
MTSPPPSPSLALAPAEVVVSYQADGSMVLRSPHPLGHYPATLGERLREWAERAPERPFLGERVGDDWRVLTYGEVFAAVRRLGAALLARGLGPRRPLLILSDNSVDNALLQLAAMHVGVPAVPASPAYSLLSQDLVNLRHIAERVQPGLVYAADGARFARAFAAIAAPGRVEVVSAAPQAGQALFTELSEETDDLAAADVAHAATGPDSVAKILFTSGSTGLPKGVLNTQRMLCSNQQAIAQSWPFLRERPPVLVDWLPWHHTFGGNHNFNMVLYHGGALYIDDGKPAPGLIDRSAENLRAHPPTLYFNVPRGFDVLLPLIEADPALREALFSRLDLIFYAGAALPQHLWARLEAAALAPRAGQPGRPVFMASAWGATETSPLITTVHFPIAHAGIIGLPAPGCEVKLVPIEGKLEMRARGPNITPGYVREPALSEAAFDADGWYRTGDAGRLADPADPRKGIVFDGRVAEDFKLTSGTWVNVGALRIAVLAAGGSTMQDAVVAGEGQAEVGLLVFPSLLACRALAPDLTELAQLTADPRVRAEVLAALERYNAEHAVSSRRVGRALLLVDPPALDAGEITDKGYINQRAVLTRRAELVALLYADPPGDAVLVLGS